MKAANAWKMLLILMGISACGEEFAEPTQEEGNARGLMTARHALTCSEEDNQPPELSLSIPDPEFHYECTGVGGGNTWVAPQATAVDACEGPLPVHQYNTGDDDGDGISGTIDPDDFGPGPTTELEGLTYVQYLAWDSSYNIQGTILSVYVQDTLPPVVTLKGTETVQTECFLPTDDPTDSDTEVDTDPNPYVEQGATAIDQCYGDLSSQVMIAGEINKQSPGVYTLEYWAQDIANHFSDPITRAVEVVDTLAPKLKVAPPLALSEPQGSMQVVTLNQCALAWDRCEGYMDITSRAYDLSITSNDPRNDAGDIQLLGNGTFAVRRRANADGSDRVYTVQYKLADNSGNVTQGTCTLVSP
jgi:hypothetical protein